MAENCRMRARDALRVCLLLPSFLVTTITVPALHPQEAQRGLHLALDYEVPLQENLSIEEALRWTFASPLGMDPSGQRVLLIAPLPYERGLRRRSGHGEAERKFQLLSVRLSDGFVECSRELTYRRGPGYSESFGLDVSSTSGHLCTIASGEIAVLDENLETVASFSARSTRWPKHPLRALSCRFFPDSNSLLVLFRESDNFRYRRSALGVYPWSENGSPRLADFKFDQTDVTPIEYPQVITINRDPGAYYRYRIAEVDLSSNKPRTLWKTFFSEHGRQRLVATSSRIFRGEWTFGYPVDYYVIEIFQPDNYYDGRERPELTELPSPSIIGRIRMWQKGGKKIRAEYGQPGYDLVWPIAVSGDERWLAARAVHYTRIVAGQYLWDDNRFVIFDVSRPEKSIFVSENFGPEEAITGFVFTPESSKLVVSTSHRLLAYNIQEGGSN